MNLKEMKEIAEKASRGPWSIENGHGGPQDLFINSKSGKRICRMWKIGDLVYEDANYIAACNPVNIAQLITAIEKMQGALKWCQTGMGDKGTNEEDWEGLDHHVLRSVLADIFKTSRKALAEVKEILGE